MSPMILRHLSVLAIGVVLSGCTAFNPYTDVPPVPAGDGASSFTIEDARQHVATVRTTFEHDRNEQTVLKNSAGALVAIGAVGAIVSGAYGASRDLILGFGLGGATGYVAGQVYTPGGYVDAYTNGLSALQCVDSKALNALGARQAETAALKALDNVARLVQRRRAAAANIPGSRAESIRGLADQALRLAEDAFNVAALSSSGEPAYASAVVNAVDVAIKAVNDQVKAASPDLATIAALARSTPGLAAGFAAGGDVRARIAAAQSAPAAPAFREGEEGRTPTADEDRLLDDLDAARKLLLTAADQLTAAATRFTRAISDVDALAACAVATPGAAVPLTLSPDATDITLNQGRSYSVVVSGNAQGQRIGDWVGVRPTDITFQIQPAGSATTMFVFTASNTLTTGKTYTFQINEVSGGPPRTKELTIKTQ